MKENIFLKKIIILFILCISIIIFLSKTSVKFNEINTIKSIKKEKKTLTRKLLEASKVQDICYNSNKNLYEYYYNGTEFDFEETIEFYDDKEYIQALITIIETKKPESKDIKKYIFHILPFIILLIIGILVPIFWIGCLCCCCCNWLCCCCCCQNNCCANCCYLVTILILIISMIFAMIGLNKYNEVFRSLNGASCSLMKFVLELKEGQEREELPKWDGIKKLQEILTNATDSITESREKMLNNFKNNMKSLNDSMDNWHNELNEKYNEVKELKLENVSIYSDEKEEEEKEDFYVSYTTQYGPYTEKQTLLYSMDQEFTTILNLLYSMEDNIKTAIEQTTASEILTNAKDQLEELLSQFDDITNSIVDPWYDYQKKGVKYGKKGCKYYFLYILGVNFLLMIFFSVIFCMKKISIIKFILHILWMTLGLFLFFVMILGSVLAILGVVGKDVISVLHFGFSEKNLMSTSPKIFDLGDGIKYINTCMNGDGDLTEAFNFDKSTEALNQIVLLRDSLIESIDTFKNYKQSINLIGYNAMLQSYQNYYFEPLYSRSQTDFSSNNLFNITSYINQLNNYTIGKAYSNCNINDKWSLKTSDNNYPIRIKKSDKNKNLGEACLIYIYDNWEENDVQERYQCIDDEDDENNINNIIKYVKTFENFKEKNKNLITKIKNENNEINNSFLSLINIINSTLITCTKVIDPIYDIFSDLMGNSSNIFSILNCKFLSTDLNVSFIQIYQGLGKDIHEFGLLVYIISVLEGFGIWGILIAMNLQNILETTKNKKTDNKTVNVINNNTEKEGLKMGKAILPPGNESNIKLILEENK
jgi:hypothetical protein